MRTRSTRYQPSLQYTDVAGGPRSFHIQEDQALYARISFKNINAIGQKHTIEASVRAWQAVLVAIVSMDIEFAHAVHTLQLLEAVERDFASTCDELQ